MNFEDVSFPLDGGIWKGSPVEAIKVIVNKLVPKDPGSEIPRSYIYELFMRIGRKSNAYTTVCSLVDAVGRDCIDLKGRGTITLTGRDVGVPGLVLHPVKGLPKNKPLLPSKSIYDRAPPEFLSVAMAERDHFVAEIENGRCC